MSRFMNDHASALAIIRPLLDNAFTPVISQKMVAPKGPNLALGSTTAGQLVGDSGERRLRAAGREDEIARLRSLLQQKYDQDRFEQFFKEHQALRKQMRLKRAGRWALRFIIVGGGLIGALLTENPKLASGGFAAAAAVGRVKPLSKGNDEDKMRAFKQKYGILSFDTVNVDDL